MIKKIIFLILIVFLVGCGSETTTHVSNNPKVAAKKSDTVRFILPNGFSGVIKISESQNGLNVKQDNGVYEITVPQNGNISLKTTTFFKTWHNEGAVFSGGSSLPNGNVEEVTPDTVCFFALWTNSDGSIYYFVGTKAQADQLQKSAWEADNMLKAQEQRG